MQKKSALHRITCLVFLAFSFSYLQAQRIDSLVNILDEKFTQEKIHVHTDKTLYSAGETIWFKAYLVADNLTTGISKTMYAELLDSKGTILERKMMPVMYKGAASNFDIPDSISQTRLFIRAYTSWMLNFDSSLLYLKPVEIIPGKLRQNENQTAKTYSVQFFPEGGDLIETIPSVIAFKATDNYGQPISITGDIIDREGKKLVSFSDIHDGMGSFLLTALPGQNYTAKWKDKDGHPHEMALPLAKKQGLVLTAKLTGSVLNYNLSRTEEIDSQHTSYRVLAQMQQRLVYGAQVDLNEKTSISAQIQTADLPNGILQLTVFNAADIPVAERLVFINQNNYFFNTGLRVTEKNLSSRGRNSLQIDVTDTLLSNLSISVTDAGLNPPTKNEESIYSQFLMSSDLKGTVYNPAYYFVNEYDSIKQQLDLVMMTNGWRRFKWEDMLAGNWPSQKNQPEIYLPISGKISGVSQNLLVNKGLNVYLITKDGRQNMITFPIEKDGSFGQDGFFFFDTAQVRYQLGNDKNKKITGSAKFSFNNSFVRTPPRAISILSALNLQEGPDSVSLNKIYSNAARQRDQVNRNKIKTLDVVKVKAKKRSAKEKVEKEYATVFFRAGDGFTLIPEEDPFLASATDILTYLQNKVAGLQISISIGGEGQATWRGSPTSFFLNEMTTTIPDLQTINMVDIAMIKIFRPPFFGTSDGGAGGAVAIYTKRGAGLRSGGEAVPLALVMGYSPVRQFYSPEYDKKPEPDLKDYRSTLYWNSFLLFDKKNRSITIPFFNNDNCKKFRVVIEGINELGQFTREEKMIE